MFLDIADKKKAVGETMLSYVSPTAPQYGGNISQVVWQVRGRERQAYTFQYDHLSRMTSATYSDISASGTVTGNRFDEKVTYDVRGNINTLQRWGLNSNCQWGMIDNLTYNYGNASYNPKNQLQSVTDASDLSKGFKTFNNGSTYAYDVNGNLKADPNKGITNITYNYLNLPLMITFTNGNNITFMYDAAGNKLRKTVTGSVNYVQDYVGGIEYRTVSTVMTLEAIYHAEGRVTNINGSLKYEYALKDHLGNTRLMFSDKNGNGLIEQNATQETSEVTQENSYYPFGMNMDGVWSNTPSVTDSKYLYNGKEWNDDYGLGWNDYGFRFYDPTIGRFPTIDLLAEVYEHQSPYVYAGNNPINFIDFMGLGPDDPDIKKDKDGGTLPTFVVTAKRVPSKTPRTDAWNNFVHSSYDRRMGITPNQWQNPYKTDEQRQSDRQYAANLGETVDDIAEAEIFIIGFAFTLEGEAVNQMLKQIFKRQAIKKTTVGVTKNLTGNTITRTKDVLGHIFRRTSGHVNPSTITSQNRYIELFEKVANEVNNLNPNVLSNYQRTSGGYEGYAKTFRNGQQVWVQTFNGKIINAGVNIVPK